MRITGPGTPGIGRGEIKPNASASSSATGNIKAAQPSDETLSARLASLLSQKGITVQSQLLRALAAELTALGMKFSDINGDVALRSLLLHSNNIPLTNELLIENFGEEKTVFQRLNTLVENAGSLLSDNAVAGENRSVLEVFVRDAGAFAEAVERLFRAEIAPALREGDPAVFSLNNEFVAQFRELLQKNGLMFEWRLLAWYRSGRDPARLLELIRGDVKGILADFLAKLKYRAGKGRTRSKLASLERDARTLFDSITNRQISSVLQNRDDERVLYLEIPFGDKQGRGDARIWARGRKKTDAGCLKPDTFSLSLDVETTGLGRVLVSMNVVEKTVSLVFSMQNEQAVEYASEMREELVGSLEARGFRVGSVTAGVIDEKSDRQKLAGYKTDVDVLG